MKTDKSKFYSEALKVFKVYPEAKSIIATGDGQFFLPAALSLAKNHAIKSGIEYFEITRQEAEEAKKSKAQDLSLEDPQTSQAPAQDPPAADRPAADPDLTPEENKGGKSPGKGSKKGSSKGTGKGTPNAKKK